MPPSRPPGRATPPIRFLPFQWGSNATQFPSTSTLHTLGIFSAVSTLSSVVLPQLWSQHDVIQGYDIPGKVETGFLVSGRGFIVNSYEEGDRGGRGRERERVCVRERGAEELQNMVITTTNITITITITSSSVAHSPVSSPPLRRGLRFMPKALICAPKITLCQHAEGSKTRRVVFLGSLISTTWPDGKPDGRCAKVPRQYVLRGRHAALDADRGGSPGLSAGDRVSVPFTEQQDKCNFTGETMGDPLLPLCTGDLRGETGAELGEWLSAGHQKSAEALLQRGHRVSPTDPPRRQDKRCT